MNANQPFLVRLLQGLRVEEARWRRGFRGPTGRYGRRRIEQRAGRGIVTERGAVGLYGNAGQPLGHQRLERCRIRAILGRVGVDGLFKGHAGAGILRVVEGLFRPAERLFLQCSLDGGAREQFEPAAAGQEHEQYGYEVSHLRTSLKARHYRLWQPVYHRDAAAKRQPRREPTHTLRPRRTVPAFAQLWGRVAMDSAMVGQSRV